MLSEQRVSRAIKYLVLSSDYRGVCASQEGAPAAAPPALGEVADERIALGLADSITFDVGFEQAAIGLSLVSLDGRWVRVNRALCALLGRPPEDLVGRSFQDLTVAADLDVGAPFLANSEQSPAATGGVQKRYVLPGGGLVAVEVTATLIRDGSGNPLGYFSQTRDLSEQQRFHDELRAERDRLGAIISNAPVPMAELDPSGRVLLWNKAAAAIFGWTAAEVVGQRMPTVLPEQWEEFVRLLAGASSGNAAGPVEVTRVRRDGTPLDLWVSCTGIPRVGAGATSVVLVGLDVTERKRMEERLFSQAYYDSLTGLANQTMFLVRLEEAVTAADGSEPRSLAVVRLGLEGLKAVNDTLGEEAGQAILVEAAQRLRGAVREGDVVACLGAEDFAVLLVGVGAGRAARIAGQLRQVIEAPMELKGRQRVLRTVAGVASRSGSRCGAEDLLREAALAMHAARSSPTSRVEVFSDRMRRTALDRLELVEDLRQALDFGDLQVLFQPIVQLDSLQICAAEALVRWYHPQHGPISPTRFVPLAEEAGLIRSLGRLVLAQACTQAASWHAAGPGGAAVHVNLSGSELMDSELADDISAALESSGLDPRRLVLELTESVLVQGAGRAGERLNSLKSLGLRISLDDFGTGYSALSYLARLPVDEIKLDRSFVQNIHLGGARSRGLVAVVVNLAQQFGLDLVAEGIECGEEKDTLAELGCTLGQGFLLGRPASAGALASKLQVQGSLAALGPASADQERSGTSRARAGWVPDKRPGRDLSRRWDGVRPRR